MKGLARPSHNDILSSMPCQLMHPRIHWNSKNLLVDLAFLQGINYLSDSMPSVRYDQKRLSTLWRSSFSSWALFRAEGVIFSISELVEALKQGEFSAVKFFRQIEIFVKFKYVLWSIYGSLELSVYHKLHQYLIRVDLLISFFVHLWYHQTRFSKQGKISSLKRHQI